MQKASEDAFLARGSASPNPLPRLSLQQVFETPELQDSQRGSVGLLALDAGAGGTCKLQQDPSPWRDRGCMLLPRRLAEGRPPSPQEALIPN